MAFRWSPDGRLVYVLPNQPLALLDPETGQQEPLPPVTLGDWSPDGGRLAYGQDGSLYVYDLSTGQEQPVVVASDGVAASDPAWSPRGDWIACTLEADGDTYVGLVSPEPAELTNTPDLLAPFEGQEAPVLRFAWSPDGSHLAALTADPRAGRQRATLYVADAPAREDTPLKWREILQLETMTQTIGLAWSPDGEKLALAAGNEIWEATAAGEATRRQRFSAPEPAWTTPEWAPDGSGFLVGLMGAGVGYTEHLYWFPANGSDPVLLLVGFDAARFP